VVDLIELLPWPTDGSRAGLSETNGQLSKPCSVYSAVTEGCLARSAQMSHCRSPLWRITAIVLREVNAQLDVSVAFRRSEACLVLISQNVRPHLEVMFALSRVFEYGSGWGSVQQLFHDHLKGLGES